MSEIDYLKLLLEPGQEASFDRRLTDFFPAIVYVYDVGNQKLKFVNKRLHDFLGFTTEDIDDHGLDSLVYKEDLDRVRAELKHYDTLKDDDSYAYNCRYNTKKGDWRHFKTMGSVMRRDEQGKAVSVLFIAQDITDQLKTEEEIQGTRELLNETEELLQFGSWSWDAHTDRLSWTAGLYRLFEFDREEIPEITTDFLMRHVVEEDRDGLKREISKAKESKTGFEYDYQIITKGGVIKSVHTKAKLIGNDKGEVVKMIGITRDITSLKALERERERSLRELYRSNQELEEFAYVASHDLQEPLRKITTFSERLRVKFSDAIGKEGAMYLERIMASAENMRILIDNLLEFSRTTRSTHTFQKTDMNVVVRNAVSDLELIIEESQATVTVDVLPSLEIVESEMQQLFSNLLSNAIKFRTPEVAPRIAISSALVTATEKELHHLPTDQEFHKITVRDNGIGFEEEYAQRIFQIFQRLHGKSEYPGSGIGLAICKKIIDNHNGVIYAESAPGLGASFMILLPEKQH